MTSLAAAVSSLRMAQAAGGIGAPGATQVASAVGALKVGSGKASGALQSIKGTVQAKLGRHGSAQDVIPSDGTRCESCGSYFGLMRRRNACASCDQFLCAACLGNPVASALGGFSCFCAAMCPRCQEQSAQSGEFESCRQAMEGGVMVTLALPRKAASSMAGGFFSAVNAVSGGSSSSSSGGGNARKLQVWLTVECDAGQIRWATLERRGGQSVEEDTIAVGEVFHVRDTGCTIEISVKDQTHPFALEFGAPDDRSTWARYLDLAVQHLTPESEKAALDLLRADHRQRELEERRALNEDRKKRYSDNLGMRFTAEAMLRMDSDASGPLGQSTKR